MLVQMPAIVQLQAKCLHTEQAENQLAFECIEQLVLEPRLRQVAAR